MGAEEDERQSLKIFGKLALLSLLQKKLEPTKKELKEKHVLIKSFREAAEVRKRGGEVREDTRIMEETLTIRDLCATMHLWLCEDCRRPNNGVRKVRDV